MPYATVNNARIYFETEGKGPSLVLVAGYSCDLTFWDLVREELASHFTLVLLDNRCCGKSDYFEGHLTIEQMALDVAALIDHLHLEKAHVLGHSMGGAIVQALAFHHPDKVFSAIISHSLFNVYPITASALRFYVRLVKEGAPLRTQIEAMLPWLCSNNFLSKDQNRETFIALNEKNHRPVFPIGIEKQLEAIAAFNPFKWYQKISLPTLILCGEEDLLCPLKDSQTLAKEIPGAKLHVFLKQGHLTPIEEPHEFCQAVIPFLKKFHEF